MDKPIIYIMGVSGSGKTTVGEELSAATGIPFFDADDFHPKSNKEKMSAGIPLTDEDRKGWLETLNELAIKHSQGAGAIIACSALKEKYRSILKKDITSRIYWVYLKGDYDLVAKRLKARKNHYMPPALLQSQFDALEPPPYAITIDIQQEPVEIISQIMAAMDLEKKR